MRPGQDPDSERDMGTLILLKATVFKGLPADLFSYRREHPEFPNQSTVNQFFDERQFDVYRELGYTTAYQMLQDLSHQHASEKADERSNESTPPTSRVHGGELIFWVE